MTTLTVWTNRLYWAICVGLILFSLGFAAERHVRRLTLDLQSPALAQVSDELSGLRRDLDAVTAQVGEQAKSLETVAERAASVVVKSTSGGGVVATGTTTRPPTTLAAQPSSSAGPISGAVVNINTASKDELMSLPGIGASYAEKIIAARPFNSVEELTKVKGVGNKTMEKLRDLVSI